MSIGQLITTVGAMGSGKTEKLIHTFKTLENSGERVKVFKPSKDTRVGSCVVESRVGATAPAISIDRVSDIYRYHTANSYGAVLIDEIQFFNEPNLINSLVALLLNGVDVYCYGLELTSEGEVFGLMGNVMAHSDEVIKLKGKCSMCGKKATMTSYSGSDKQGEVKVGDLDEYKPMCRECYYDEIDDVEDEDPLYFFEMGDDLSGFKAELLVRRSSLVGAGYSYEDVLDICTLEGAKNLLNDLGIKESE